MNLVARGKAQHQDAGVFLLRPWPSTTIAESLALIEQTGADELIVAAAIWDHDARVRSFELLADAMTQPRRMQQAG